MNIIHKEALSKYRKKRQIIHDKYNGLCAYTGKPLGDDWQVDHMFSRFEWEYHNKEGDVNNIDNLIPSLRIVNHYKRSKNIEQFREYMSTFQKRLAKLPKKTSLDSTKKRIAYMNSVADSFGITTEKPFNGVFYFETL